MSILLRFVKELQTQWERCNILKVPGRNYLWHFTSSFLLKGGESQHSPPVSLKRGYKKLPIKIKTAAMVNLISVSSIIFQVVITWSPKNQYKLHRVILVSLSPSSEVRSSGRSCVFSGWWGHTLTILMDAPQIGWLCQFVSAHHLIFGMYCNWLNHVNRQFFFYNRSHNQGMSVWYSVNILLVFWVKGYFWQPSFFFKLMTTVCEMPTKSNYLA